MVPGLEARLMDGDEDEVIHVADVVSVPVVFNVHLFAELAPTAPERRFKRPIRRHEEPQRGCA